MYQYFQIESHDKIGILRFNRPDRLNAFDAAMSRELPLAFHAVLNDDNSRVVVLTGNGRGFCAGADVNFLQDLAAGKKLVDAENLVIGGRQVIEMLRSSDKPVIAAINGPAAGGGAGIALACDLRLMAQSASIGFTFSRIGLHPDLGCMYFLPRLAGPAKAAELFMTGEMIGADEAFRIGLVNRIVPDADLLPAAMALARTISTRSALALRLIKKGLNQSPGESMDKVLEYEVDAQKSCFASAEALAAIQQFLVSRRKG